MWIARDLIRTLVGAGVVDKRGSILSLVGLREEGSSAQLSLLDRMNATEHKMGAPLVLRAASRFRRSAAEIVVATDHLRMLWR